ncbi:MAG: AAA family ATPase [Ignisphaera sp.]|nr:AAA family ATPase [Ignisphaera sp.]MCX8168307.1 AAA family ATPase [Ignisphaera sp.]MDW8085361.1 AAA family ATPase [Ignisphaera sp.]
MMRRPFIASVSGKGGSGKTVLTALLTKILIERETDDEILIVDGDPATNLPEVLGVELRKTIGEVVEEFRRSFHDQSASVSYRKDTLLEYLIMRDCLAELDRFDFIAMGRGEGEGCYCFVNSLLIGILSKLIHNYTVVLMDMEAGLEHISRRTDRYVNNMLIVVDPSMMSFRTAERIKEVAIEVGLKVNSIYIVGNRIPQIKMERLYSWSREQGFEVAGIVPYDALIEEFNTRGIPLLKLPSNTAAVEAVRSIAKRISLID